MSTENQTKLKVVDPLEKKGPIISIVSYTLKHLSRLHEAALRERAEIHKHCDVLEKELKILEIKYAKSLKKLRKVQIEVDNLEYKILMENINRNRG